MVIYNRKFQRLIKHILDLKFSLNLMSFSEKGFDLFFSIEKDNHIENLIRTLNSKP